MPRQRSPRGEGSLYWRDDRKRWCLELDLTDRGGRRVRRSWSFKTRAEAQRKRRALLAQRDAGQPQVNERQNVHQFITRYEQTILVGKAGNTRRNVGAALNLIRPTLGHHRLVALQPDHIQKLYADLQAADYAPATIGLVHSVLSRILRQAVAWGDLARNPAAAVHPPRLRRPAPRFLDVAEVQQLLAAVQGDRLEAFVWLAVTTGLREGELIGLYWSDLDLEAGVLRVQRQYTRDEGITPPKSARGVRVIPLAAPTRRVLLSHKAEAKTIADNPLVFPSRAGTPLRDMALRMRWWYPLLARAGLPRVVPHSLRHSCGSFLLHLGMPLAQVSRILGHSSVAVTSAVYIHALSADERDYFERLGRLLDPGDKPSTRPSGEPTLASDWRQDGDDGA